MQAVVTDMAIDREFEFTMQDFEFLATLAYKKTGIVLQQHKYDMVYGRVARRLRALKLNDVRDYCALIESDRGQDEIGNLINALTTNLTSFFREPHHFQHLAQHVLKPFAAQSRETRLRIWSAGCSAGAETYSIAMMMAEHLPETKRRDALILATDIDTNMLRTGAIGEYTADWIAKIPADLRQKYTMRVSRNGDDYRMHEQLKNMIRFKPLNLLESWPIQGKFDAVFCRNVVIYFDKKTQVALFQRIAEHIKPGGYLYIGHSETLNHLSNRFELVDTTTYQRIA